MASLCLSAGGRYALAGAEYTARLHLWDVASGRHVRTVEGPTPWTNDLAFVAGDRFAVSAHWDGVHVWDVSGGGHLRILDEEDDASCVAAPADGRFVVAGHRDGTVRVWELDWEPSPGVHPGGADI